MIMDLVSISILALCYLGYIWMVKKFCKKYLETSKRNEKLFVIFFFCGRVLMYIINKSYFIPGIVYALLNHIFFIGLLLFLFQKDTEKIILVVSILITITTLVENFCMSFFSCFILFWLHTMKGIAIPFFEQWEIRLIACGSLMIVILVIDGLSKYLMSVFYCKTRRWYLILAIPLLAITAVTDVANWGASNGILVRSGGSMGLYYDQIFSHAEIGILTVLSMFAAGFYVFGMNRIYLEQKKSSHYHVQIIAYKILEEQYSQSKRLRHDLKNHIIALLGLMENKEWGKMESYLRNMEEHVSLGMEEEITGNRIVDVLLCQKREIAERKNMRWECDVQIPKVCDINEFDLCVLFGNILDNAVEACERLQGDSLYDRSQQFIDIQGRVIKRCFLLEVKNSSDRADKYNVGVTNKENPGEHGIGLLNIRDVVRKYNGTMNIEVQNGIFIISVLIPLSNAVYDMKQVI